MDFLAISGYHSQAQGGATLLSLYDPDREFGSYILT